MQKNKIYRCGNRIMRVLDEREGEILVIDCVKKTMPKWINHLDLAVDVEMSEEELREELGAGIPEKISTMSAREMQKRFSVIAGILPYVGEKKKRSLLIQDCAGQYGVSQNTVKNYLMAYLIYQDMTALAPKEKTGKRELTKDEKNMRWALNKFYYTRQRQSLKTAYTLMLKEKYCDTEGKLKDEYPSIYQFRYFYEKTKKLQNLYISRNGLKDYQRNQRPLLGDGIQAFAFPGVGMLDATICDIYLVDEARNVVGRPMLLACIDAYSSFCYGYSLVLEGGVYSVRSLLNQVIEDKVDWCRKFGIVIRREQWDCDCLPGVMITDMGAEYASGNFEQITELGVRVINLPAYRPELKGAVEKFFDLIQSEYKKILKGKGVIEDDYKERGARDYRKDACLTMDDFEKVVLRCIIYYNSQRIIENFPYTEEMLKDGIRPYAASIFQWGREHLKPDLISVSRKALVQTLLPRASGRFTRSGLKVNGMRYHKEGYTEQYLQGGEALVAYNPEDISCVWLVSNGNYEEFHLIESRFQGKTLFESRELKKECREMIKSADRENMQARIELARHIQGISGRSWCREDVKIKDIRPAREREQRKRHRDFVEGGGFNG